MARPDMPLEQLLCYKGRNERPDDFDAFWERSLAEMEAVDPNIEMTPNPFPSNMAECFDLRFTSTQGARIYARFARPRNIKGKVPAVLLFHGYSAYCSTFKAMMCYVAQGYCVAAMDCRGQGGLSEDPGGTTGSTFSSPFSRGIDGPAEKMPVRNMFLDTALLAKIVMALPYVDESRVATQGASQGAGLALACAALVPSIKLCSLTYPYMSDYRRTWEIDAGGGAYEGLRFYFRNFDPQHQREKEIFTKLGYIDIQHLAPRVKAKVLMLTGLADRTCCPSTQFAMYNKLNCEKSYLLYPDFGHEGIKDTDDTIYSFLANL